MASERSTYHDNFTKSMGRIEVSSYGGGWPRAVRIKDGRDEMSMTYSEARDLRYVLDRLIAEIGEDRP